MASDEPRQEQTGEGDVIEVASVRIPQRDLRAVDMAAVLVGDHRSGFMAKASVEQARRVLKEHGVTVPG